MTGGIGPDACIDCVGMESHGFGIDNVIDTVKAHTFLGTDRPARAAPGDPRLPQGRAGLDPGVYGGMADKFPIGALMEKGLTRQDRPDPRPEIHASCCST